MHDIRRSSSETAKSSASAALASATIVIATLALLYFMAARANRGFDFTDEAFYLMWMSAPYSYKLATSQFGYIYRPIYNLLFGDITLLRLAGYAIDYVLAALLTYRVLTLRVDHGGTVTRAVTAAAVATSALLLTAFELPHAPSYNTIVYQSALICALAVTMLCGPVGRISNVLCILAIGIASALAFLSKPPAGAMMLAAGGGFLLAVAPRRLSAALILAAAFAAALAVGAWIIDGSPLAYVLKLRDSLRVQGALGGKGFLASMTQWTEFPLDRGRAIGLLVACLACFVLFQTMIRSDSRIRAFGCVLCSALCVGAILVLFRGYLVFSQFERFDALVILGLPIACMLVAVTRNGWRSFAKRDLALVAFLLFLPFAYAFGTNRPYVLNAEGAVLFWLLAGLVVLPIQASTRLLLLPAAAVTLLFSSLFVADSQEYPHRQTQPLRLDTHRVSTVHGDIYLSDDAATYVSDLQKLASAGNFQAGTPVIDMTGHSPGAVLLIGGKAPGVAWLSGGYPGSNDFAAAVLDTVACAQRAKAWLLTEPDGEENLNPSILARYDFDMARDYEDLGSVQTTLAVFPKSYAQHLLKPKAEALKRRLEKCK